jgi:hypothetical protein
MSYELIQQADFALSRCGGRTLPDGLVAVDFPGGLVYNAANLADQVTTGTRDNPEDTTFYVRAVSVAQDANTYGRLQWPDGSFASNQPVSLGGLGWNGPFKKLFSKEIPILPGQAITIFTNPVPTQGAGVASNVSLLFEGCHRYQLRGGRYFPITSAADALRYARSPNGNILAPEMDLDTEFLEIPTGQGRMPFTLGSLSSQAVTIASPGGNSTIEIPVSSSFDIFARRFTFEYSFDGGVSGDLLVKARDGSGYALHSDYALIGQVQDAPLAKAWCVRRGVSMYFDFALRNGVGVGNVNLTSVQVHGVRQKGTL